VSDAGRNGDARGRGRAGGFPDSEVDRRIRALAEREGRTNRVTVRRLDPAEVRRPDLRSGAVARDMIVGHLVDHGPASTPELVQRLGLDRRTVKASISALQRNGLIARDGERRGARGRPQILYCAVAEVGAPDPSPQSRATAGAAAGTSAKGQSPEASDASSVGESRSERVPSQETEPSEPDGGRSRTARDNEPVTVDRLTVREQLAIRYVSALIGQVDR
jgi:hypothetical protein